MKFSMSYMQSRDIDWFCCIEGIYVHIASAGGELPNIVNNRKILRKIQLAVSRLNDIYEEKQIIFNEEVIKKRLRSNIDRLIKRGVEVNLYNEEESYRNYISTFAAMARKGFVSYDRINIFDITDNRYSWVARPYDFPQSRKPDLELPQLSLNELNFVELLQYCK